jgi:hypothetical protein
VGIAGILLVLGEVKRGEKAPELFALWPAIDRAHARAGAKMVELWKLSPEVAMVVGAHHQVSIDGVDYPPAALVCLAESLTAELAMALAPSGEEQEDAGAREKLGLHMHARIDQSDPPVIARAREALGLTEAQVERIREDGREWSAAEGAQSDSGNQTRRS